MTDEELTQLRRIGGFVDLCNCKGTSLTDVEILVAVGDKGFATKLRNKSFTDEERKEIAKFLELNKEQVEHYLGSPAPEAQKGKAKKR